MMGISKKFLENGYVIVTAENQEPLIKVKQIIFEKCKQVFNYEGEDADWFFNNYQFHKISPDELNIKRLEIIEYCTHSTEVNELIFEAFKKPIIDLLGRDIMVQKVTNLVIQPPEDLNTSDPHRDTPTDSFYSIVIWVPLNDSYGTKTLKILELEKSKKLIKLIQSNPDNWSEVASTVLEKGISAEVPFGSGIILWPNLYHGSEINTETETRWTLNVRYINAFAPKGHKDPLDILNYYVSPTTKLALEAEKVELSK